MIEELTEEQSTFLALTYGTPIYLTTKLKETGVNGSHKVYINVNSYTDENKSEAISSTIHSNSLEKYIEFFKLEKDDYIELHIITNPSGKYYIHRCPKTLVILIEELFYGKPYKIAYDLV